MAHAFRLHHSVKIILCTVVFVLCAGTVMMRFRVQVYVTHMGILWRLHLFANGNRTPRL